MGSYLGQNFLKDTKVQQYIAEKIQQIYDKTQSTTIIEIGPGKGAITKRIHNIPKHFLVIEKDTTMKIYLDTILSKDQIIFADILETDPHALLVSKQIKASQTVIVGNLPYYITSPILRKFFGYGKQDFAGGFFMIQKEVGEKINSTAGKKSYLRWLLNHSYDITYTKTVPAKAFKPAPKVSSCLIALTKKEQPRPFPFEKMIAFLDIFAPYSRKTLGKIAKMTKSSFCIPDDIAHKRLEDVTVEDLQKIL